MTHRPVPLWLAFVVFLAVVFLILAAVACWPWLLVVLLVLATVGAVWQAVTRR